MDSECLGVVVGIWVVLWPPLHLSPRLLEVLVAGYPVLLLRNRKEFRALGSKCPHYGAPLSKGNPDLGKGEKAMLGRLVLTAQLRGFLSGVLRGERLRCPWHGACFNIRTGDIEEYPALDCISCFKVISPHICVPLTLILSHQLHVPDTKSNPPALATALSHRATTQGMILGMISRDHVTPCPKAPFNQRRCHRSWYPSEPAQVLLERKRGFTALPECSSDEEKSSRAPQHHVTSKIRARARWHTGPGSPGRAPTTTSWMQHLKNSSFPSFR